MNSLAQDYVLSQLLIVLQLPALCFTLSFCCTSHPLPLFVPSVRPGLFNPPSTVFDLPLPLDGFAPSLSLPPPWLWIDRYGWLYIIL